MAATAAMMPGRDGREGGEGEDKGKEKGEGRERGGGPYVELAHGGDVGGGEGADGVRRVCVCVCGDGDGGVEGRGRGGVGHGALVQMTARDVGGREEGNAGVGCVCVVREEGPVVTGLIYIPSKKKRKGKERTGKNRKGKDTYIRTRTQTSRTRLTYADARV